MSQAAAPSYMTRLRHDAEEAAARFPALLAEAERASGRESDDGSVTSDSLTSA